MRIFRSTTIAAFCAALTLLLLSSCDHKELCFHHPHTQTIRLVFDWRDAPDAHPEGMVVYFFPLVETDENRSDETEVPAPDYRYRFNLPTTGGQLEGILPGRYRIITYNNDTDGVLFTNDDNFDTHIGFTREGSVLEPIYGNASNRAPHAPGAEDQRVVICPDVMWGCSVVDLNITEQGITYVHYPFEPEKDMDITKPITNTEHIITLYPHLLTCYYDYEIRNVTNLENTVQMCCSLSGMAPSLRFGDEELGREVVTIPFGAVPNHGSKTITGNFITWGHHELNTQKHYLLLYVWMKGEPLGWCYSMDVTDQVHAAPDKRHVHLVVDGLDLPVIINPNDGGFEPSVDDWVVENMDLVM